MKRLSDDDLVDGYRVSKNPEFLTEIFLRYSDIAFRTAFQFSKNNSDAEDAAQNAFIKCMNDLNQYQLGTNFKAWLMRIVVNSCKNKKIEDQRRSSRHEKYSAQKENFIANEDKLVKNEIQVVIRNTVASLPEKYRAPIWLVLFEGFTYADASKSLEMPEKTIRTQVSRGLEKIKEILKKSGILLSVSSIIELTVNAPLVEASEAFKNKCVSVATSPSSKFENIVAKDKILQNFHLVVLILLVGVVLSTWFFLNINVKISKVVPSNSPTKNNSTYKKWTFENDEDLSGIKIIHGNAMVVRNIGVFQSNCLLIDAETVIEFDISEFQLPIKLTHSFDSGTLGMGLVSLKNNYEEKKNIFSFGRLQKPKDIVLKKNENAKNGFFGGWFTRINYISSDCIDTWFEGKRSSIVYGTSKDNKKIYFYAKEKYLFDNIVIESIKKEELPSYEKFSEFVNKIAFEQGSKHYDITNQKDALQVDKDASPMLGVFDKQELEKQLGLSDEHIPKSLVLKNE